MVFYNNPAAVGIGPLDNSTFDKCCLVAVMYMYGSIRNSIYASREPKIFGFSGEAAIFVLAAWIFLSLITFVKLRIYN